MVVVRVDWTFEEKMLCKMANRYYTSFHVPIGNTKYGSLHKLVLFGIKVHVKDCLVHHRVLNTFANCNTFSIASVLQ